MTWKILSFSNFLGAMLGQISRTHFFVQWQICHRNFVGKEFIFFIGKSCQQQSGARTSYYPFNYGKFRKGKIARTNNYIFSTAFFNKQNTWSRVVKAHLFEWQTACKTQSYFGCFKRKTDIKHHILSACCCL